MPPSVLRESRENHERSLQSTLTAIALKLDKLTEATQANAEEMKGQYCRQEYVDTALMKMRADLTQQESKVIANARSAALSGISAMSEKLDREKKKLQLVIAKQEAMVKELREVQHELAEEDAAEELINAGDTDVLSMKGDAEKMAALFEDVANQANAAEEKMHAMMDEQNERDAEFNALKSGLQHEAAESQKRAMMASKNATDREAKLQKEMMKMANEMGQGAQVSREMEEKMAAQAAALAASDKDADAKMLSLQAQLAEEQAKLAASVNVADSESQAYRLQLEEQRRAGLAEMENKMHAEAEELKRERAAADQAALELRERMDAEFNAKLASVESGGATESEAAQAKADMMMQQLDQERKMIEDRAEAQKAAAESSRLQMEQQMASMEAQMNEQPEPSAAGSGDTGGQNTEEIQAMLAELKAERDRMVAAQEASSAKETDAESEAAAEFERLQEQLKASASESSGVDAAAVKAGMDKMRAEEQARISEANQRQEDERIRMMDDMKKMQEALFAEREKAALEQQQMKAEMEASNGEAMASQLALVQSGMDEKLSAQEQGENARQALEAPAAKDRMAEIQAQMNEEKDRREKELGDEKQKMLEFQEEMKKDIANLPPAVPPEQKVMDLIVEQKASPKVIELVLNKKTVDMICTANPSADRDALSGMSPKDLAQAVKDADLTDAVDEEMKSEKSKLSQLDLAQLKTMATDLGVDGEDVAVAVKSATAELSKLKLQSMDLTALTKAAEELGVDKSALTRAATPVGGPKSAKSAPVDGARPGSPGEITKKGKSRVQRKLDEKVLIEELRGRVGALTLKMGRLGKLLNGMEGADDFIPFVNQRLKELQEEKAAKTDLTDLEQKLMDMGVGGGESMGNALKSMENSIEDVLAQLASLIASKVDMSHVTGEAEKVQASLQAEIDKLAEELIRIYRTTDARIDDVDEVKAEKDWIEDMLAKIRRQVGGLKKQMGEGGGADGGAMGMLAGSLSAMMVKGEHPPNWPPNITHDANGMTQKRASGAGQQLVYKGGFPMTNSTVPIPTRTSMDMSSGVMRETMQYGQLTRAAASELLPRLMSEADFNATMGTLAGSGEQATLTADLVDRFRKSIWPPPSVPAFGSWPSPGDVLDRAESLGHTMGREDFNATQGSMGPGGSPTGSLSPLRETSRSGMRSPTRTPSRLQMQRGARAKGGGVKMTPPRSNQSRQVEPEPEFATLQVRTGRNSAPPSVV